jgi:hypothetical protein
MYAAILPFWGRRYVNASHPDQSLQVFAMDNIYEYGIFLGERYGNEPHIIWVNGGDVGPDKGGNFMPQYRLFAEGLARGVTGKSVNWNQKSEAWDELFITYHPDGRPMMNSSEWFHQDVWLDFNMIETHVSRHKIVDAITKDLDMRPLKPTVLGEGHYEGYTGKDTVLAIHIRRQAYQTFFSGAAGFTYGGFFGESGNGPLFSPSNNWEPLLEMEGAGQLRYLKQFLVERDWPEWELYPGFIVHHRGEGELEKLAVRVGQSVLVYFPDRSSCKITNIGTIKETSWYNMTTGEIYNGNINSDDIYTLPGNLDDGILILEYE